MKLYELILSKGTFIERITKTVGANTGFSYYRGEKGLSLKGNSGNTVIFTQVVAGIKTILFGIKKNVDSKIFLDNVTDKLEITGGNVSGTGLTQCYVDGVDTDVVGSNQYHFVVAEFSAGITFATNVKIAPSSLIYLADKIVFYDSLLTVQERSDAYKKFLYAVPMHHETYPKSLPEQKPTDLSRYQDRGLLLAYNMIPSPGGAIVDISGNEGTGAIYGAISFKDGLCLDGVDDYISVNLSLAPAATVQTIAFRIKLATTTEQIYEGQSNNILILANAGTLVYVDFDNAYVDGIDTDTIVAGQWHNIIVTSSTAVDNNTPSIGYNSGLFTYGKFKIVDFKMFNYEFTEAQAQEYHNQFAKKVVFFEDLRYEPVGATCPSQAMVESGSFEIAEDATSKYIDCTATGTLVYKGIDLSNAYPKKSEGSNYTLHNSVDGLTVNMITDGVLRNILYTDGYIYSSYCPEYQIVHDSFTTEPDGVRAAIYNTMVKALVDGGYWARMDLFHFLANHINTAGEALINWFNPGTFDATNFNNPIHTADQGILYNGATQYTMHNWIASVNGVNYVQNSASQILYIRTNVATNSGAHGIYSSADSKDCFINQRVIVNTAYIRINDGTSVLSAAAHPDGSGLYFNTRTAAAVNLLYRNKVPIINGTTASTGAPTHKPYTGCYNDDDVAAGFRADQVAIVIYMDGCTQADVTGISDILNAAMTALGTNVY